MKISACIIAMDEADRIGPCLTSVSFCDEVLVLDSGSRDGTPDLCRRAGARVIETDWPGYAAQKNRALEAASHDWVLSLDADERVDAPLRAAIEALRAGGEPPAGGPAAYEMTRKVFVHGRWIRHGGWYPEWRARLFDRRRAQWVGDGVHERVEAKGSVARIREGSIEHFTYRSLSDQWAKMDRFATAAAREIYAKGRRASLLPMVFRPPFKFLRMYVLRLGFLDGRAGFVLAFLSACSGFLKHAKLWELCRDAGRSRR